MKNTATRGSSSQFKKKKCIILVARNFLLVAHYFLLADKYNIDKKHLSQCNICQKYNQYSVQALQQKWKNSWGDFHVVVQKIQENDKNFIDAGSYSSCNRHEIIRLLEVCAQKK